MRATLNSDNFCFRRLGMLMGDEVLLDKQFPRCHLLPGLTKSQSKLCQLYTDHIPAVASGARQALSECKHQFQYRRWNCSLIDDVSVFGPVLSVGKYFKQKSNAHVDVNTKYIAV